MTESLFVVEPIEGTDDYGNVTWDYDVEPVEIAGCLFEPVRTEEAEGERSRTVANVYAPAGTEVSRLAQVTVRGSLWVVDGDPEVWAGYGPGGVVIRLVKVSAAVEVGS